MATKSSKLSETRITDADETEAEEGDNDSEPATPTPAPRFRVGRDDQMSIMRLLNEEAEGMGYDARRSRSSSN
jgi:hypothetical protein